MIKNFTCIKNDRYEFKRRKIMWESNYKDKNYKKDFLYDENKIYVSFEDNWLGHLMRNFFELRIKYYKENRANINVEVGKDKNYESFDTIT